MAVVVRMVVAKASSSSSSSSLGGGIFLQGIEEEVVVEFSSDDNDDMLRDWRWIVVVVVCVCVCIYIYTVQLPSRVGMCHIWMGDRDCHPTTQVPKRSLTVSLSLSLYTLLFGGTVPTID